MLKELNNLCDRGQYIQTLHDPIQTHGWYGLSASGNDVQKAKDLLKSVFKANNFRVVKNGYGFAILCFKIKK